MTLFAIFFAALSLATGCSSAAKPDLDAKLAHDLAPAVQHGPLKEGTGTGLVIGVIQNEQRRIFVYGAARPDSIFEIGSITKTFTGLVLAQMVLQKKVNLDQPVRELLPTSFADKPDGEEITLLDLADQHSALPREPDNLVPLNPLN